MKSLNVFKKIGLGMLALTFVTVSANAQARYKHMPRVKVDATAPTYSTNNDRTDSKVSTNTTTASYIEVEKQIELATVPVVNENSTASTTNDIVTDVKTNKTVTKQKNTVTKKEGKKKILDFSTFTKKLTENSKLLKVKDVKKSKLEKWLMWMIIMLGLGLLFIILAVVFAVTLFYSLYILSTIFWILGGLCLLAAVIFLILGLAGVM